MDAAAKVTPKSQVTMRKAVRDAPGISPGDEEPAAPSTAQRSRTFISPAGVPGYPNPASGDILRQPDGCAVGIRPPIPAPLGG